MVEKLLAVELFLTGNTGIALDSAPRKTRVTDRRRERGVEGKEKTQPRGATSAENIHHDRRT